MLLTIRERLRAMPLEELEALAKKARVGVYNEEPAMAARRFRGRLCSLSLKDLATLDGRAMVHDYNEKKAWLIEQLIPKVEAGFLALPGL